MRCHLELGRCTGTSQTYCRRGPLSAAAGRTHAPATVASAAAAAAATACAACRSRRACQFPAEGGRPLTFGATGCRGRCPAESSLWSAFGGATTDPGGAEIRQTPRLPGFGPSSEPLGWRRAAGGPAPEQRWRRRCGGRSSWGPSCNLSSAPRCTCCPVSQRNACAGAHATVAPRIARAAGGRCACSSLAPHAPLQGFFLGAHA
mmetsp:Transcript_18379/g.53088  ORF Transcript_18379/g.53088 Transcript_18379/m.53088 type:complete len:204 (+) Transcript_18379:1306-1917(+)